MNRRQSLGQSLGSIADAAESTCTRAAHLHERCLGNLPRLASFVLVSAAIVTARAAAASEDHPHLHHAAVFAGATAADDTTAATAGADYEYRARGWLGVAALADFAILDHVTTILAAGAVVHPLARLKIIAAPGVELADGESAFVLRVGAAYDVPFGAGSITPTYNADIADGHLAHVFGLAFGHGF